MATKMHWQRGVVGTTEAEKRLLMSCRETLLMQDKPFVRLTARKAYTAAGGCLREGLRQPHGSQRETDHHGIVSR